MAALDVRAIYTGLASLFVDLSGLRLAGDATGEFEFAPDDQQAEISFEIFGIVGVGTDELRSAYDPDAVIEGDTYEPDPDNPAARLGGFVDTVCGNRRVTITVKVECDFQDITAHPYLEAIRDKLEFPSSQDRLDLIGLSIARISASRNCSYEVDGHAVSSWAFDLICTAGTSVSDAPITTIEVVDSELVSS
jgi:hypothetical protein